MTKPESVGKLEAVVTYRLILFGNPPAGGCADAVESRWRTPNFVNGNVVAKQETIFDIKVT